MTNTIDCSVHFWTLRQIGYDDTNTALTFYHDRTHFQHQNRNSYAQFTEELSLQQGRHFCLHNRLACAPNKISKLKDQVKELDELFATNSLENSIRINSTNGELMSSFYASFGAVIVKTIWLSTPGHMLCVMQNGTLVWILIDTLSGDIRKILFDKSLETLKTSGKYICDAALISKSDSKQSPILVLAYYDQSRIDLISFGKATQINEYLNKSEANLDKLASFEPTLISYEFSCPTFYYIEKRILTQTTTSSSNFCLWWPNDGQLAYMDSKQRAVSLLERDDLRTNILILSTNLADQNLLEYMFKSDGHLLGLSYVDEKSLVAVELIETTSEQRFSIMVFRYEIPSEGCESASVLIKPSLPKVKLASFNLNSSVVSIDQVKFGKKFVVMLCADQTLVLYDISRNLFFKHRINTSSEANTFNGIDWLLEDVLFMVYNLNGQLLTFDVSLNKIGLTYMTKHSVPFHTLSECLNPNIYTPIKSTKTNGSIPTNLNRLVRVSSSNRIEANSLWSSFQFSKGPVGMFRLALPKNFNHISLVHLHLKNSQRPDCNNSIVKKKPPCDFPFVSSHLEKAVNVLKMLNWDEDGATCLAILYNILNFLLSDRVAFDIKLEVLVEETLGTFYKPRRELSEKTIYEFRHRVSRCARRYFYNLLRNSSLSKAFLLAVDIGGKDLFNDLYYCALDKNEKQLAEMCRKRYHEIEREENEAKLRDELNRSLTSIDDNIKAAYSEFDKYSVSSSERDSDDSDIEIGINDQIDYEYMNESERASLSEKKLSVQSFGKSSYDRQVDRKADSIKLKDFTEEDIQAFSKRLLLDNYFINQYNF